MDTKVRIAGALAVVLMFVVIAEHARRTSSKLHIGMDEVAQRILTDQQCANKPVLIVSDATGEGDLIAEIAEHEQRPRHVIERGSKMLASMGFMGDNYRERFTTPQQLEQFFERSPDFILVLDTPDMVAPHVTLTHETISEYASSWEVLGTYPRRHAGRRNLPETTIEILRLRSKNGLG